MLLTWKALKASFSKEKDTTQIKLLQEVKGILLTDYCIVISTYVRIVCLHTEHNDL